MKKIIATAILTLAFTSGACLADEPAVLAKVNGHEITRVEIDQAFAGMTMDQPGQKLTFEKTPVDFQKAFVEKYIEKQLIVDAARKANLQNDPEIKQKLKDAEDFLIQQKYLTGLVLAQKSDDKLKKIYDDKLKNKEGAEEIHAYHILVKTEDEAKKVRADVVKNGDFEKIAKAKSIEPGAKVSGGDLGYFTADQMVPEFSKAAFALNKGDISQPVQTQFGWHVIKIVDKRKKAIPTFAQSKPALENEFASQVIDENVKKLKSQATIEYYGDLAKAGQKPASTPLIKKVDDSSKPTTPAPAASSAPVTAPTDTPVISGKNKD